MCGIAGIWGRPAQDRLAAMADRLRHRGPDDDGFWVSAQDGIGFAHRRLSIIDLGGGRQPIFNEDGRIVTIFNGEIYNYKELREDLIARGHVLRTNTDTEVIVHLYEDYGVDAVDHLRGMFAIALWDGLSRQLVLYRDRAGKKPLYYSVTDGEFCFASEIKGLVAAGAAEFEVDYQSLADYLSWGSIHPPATIYRRVFAVGPAETVIVRDRRVVQKRAYWRMQMLPKQRVGFDEAVERIDGMIREAVRLRLRSDVPVGSFLSGGLDSGIVTAMAAQEYPGRLITVTVGFTDGPYDERRLAGLLAERYGTEHHELLVTPDAKDVLPKIAAAYDQPFADSSAIPTYYVSQAARRHVKVVLNGDGGDELFCGYRRHFAARINRSLRWIDARWSRPLWRAVSAVLPVPRSVGTPYAFVHRLVRGMSLDPCSRHMAWTVDGFAEDEFVRMIDPHAWPRNLYGATRLVKEQFDRLDGVGPMDRMLATDFVTILAPDLLVKMDVASMAHGLETRAPLLDHVLIDVVSRFPENVKLRGLQTKPLMRALGRRYLPVETLAERKHGFEIPLVRWLREDLAQVRDDVVLSRQGILAEIFDRAQLERLVRGETSLDPRRWSTRVWMLLMLGMWDRYVRPGRTLASTSY